MNRALGGLSDPGDPPRRIAFSKLGPPRDDEAQLAELARPIGRFVSVGSTRLVEVPRPEPPLPRVNSFEEFRWALGGRFWLNEEFGFVPRPEKFLETGRLPPDQWLGPCQELGGRFAPNDAVDLDVFPQFELGLRPDQFPECKFPEFKRATEVRLGLDQPPRAYPELADCRRGREGDDSNPLDPDPR